MNTNPSSNAAVAMMIGPDPLVVEAIDRGNAVVFFDVAMGGGGNDITKEYDIIKNIPTTTSIEEICTNHSYTYLGRIKLELFVTDCPKTCENFRQFCTGEYISTHNQQPMGYKGCLFHRVMKQFMIQSGDFIHHDGTGSTSIYGTTTFPDENFIYQHNQPGLLSCANSGPNTNGCQFFITTAAADWLNNKHCIFGKVLDMNSMITIRKIENTPVNGTEPRIPIRIIQCGEL
jgi:peptidyl-prolyl isomerase H (cyclophilin H)